ncbi:hypothetical protein [Pseudarthrobacter sulfonivorans]|uniref:hypothetical protein n=1 Tax=Pseudarthrobacter sulfonivorans TaxID=121292 RepID=UPI002102BA89|nr:hypothetical protein [Pseudarthrobacter sulfonivorans]
MKWLHKSLVSVTASFIITMAVVVIAFVLTMFSASDVGVRKFGLFGSLFFEPHELDNGATGLEFGVANGFPIFVIFLLATLFAFATAVMFDRLKAYKKTLQEQGVNPA